MKIEKKSYKKVQIDMTSMLDYVVLILKSQP